MSPSWAGRRRPLRGGEETGGWGYRDGVRDSTNGHAPTTSKGRFPPTSRFHRRRSLRFAFGEEGRRGYERMGGVRLLLPHHHLVPRVHSRALREALPRHGVHARLVRLGEVERRLPGRRWMMAGERNHETEFSLSAPGAGSATRASRTRRPSPGRSRSRSRGPEFDDGRGG